MAKDVTGELTLYGTMGDGPASSPEIWDFGGFAGILGAWLLSAIDRPRSSSLRHEDAGCTPETVISLVWDWTISKTSGNRFEGEIGVSGYRTTGCKHFLDARSFMAIGGLVSDIV